jgi:hypothetical protein
MLGMHPCMHGGSPSLSAPGTRWSGDDRCDVDTRAYGPSSPIDLLRRADENWNNTHPYTRYGPSYHTALPSHWAQRFLGLNFTCLLTNHLQSRLHKLQAIQQRQRLQSSTRKKLYNPVGRTLYTSSYTSRLRHLCTHYDCDLRDSRLADNLDDE